MVVSNLALCSLFSSLLSVFCSALLSAPCCRRHRRTGLRARRQLQGTSLCYYFLSTLAVKCLYLTFLKPSSYFSIGIILRSFLPYKRSWIRQCLLASPPPLPTCVSRLYIYKYLTFFFFNVHIVCEHFL